MLIRVLAVLWLVGLCSAQKLLAPLLSAGQIYETIDDTWRRNAIQKLWVERQIMRHTPVFKFSYPGAPHVDFIFKNETASRSDTLKHRYAWALMMWALVEGHVTQNTTVYEASSGNTAASLSFMCTLVGVPFIAVVPDTIEDVKTHHITKFGGRVLKAPNAIRWQRAQEEAQRNGGFFMNQFGNADKAEEFHESGNYPLESVNVFHELLRQMDSDPTQIVKVPHYFVMPAGTGGTISSVGKYVKKYGLPTKIVFADTQFSLYADYVLNNRFVNESGQQLVVAPGIAGIGTLPTGMAVKGFTTSLDRGVIDRVMKIPDLASTAAMAVLRRLNINGGTSTGVNFVAALTIAARERASNPASGRLTISTILCDPGDFYLDSYLNREWIDRNFAYLGGLQAYDCWMKIIEDSLQQGRDPLLEGSNTCGKMTLNNPSHP